ncbi:MAG TPA: recombinase, partial [Firmicutes bacterium]|nr:recombinase [Bacillota bacterium]
MRRVTLNSRANRGRTLELMVEWQNASYRSQGLAVVHKVPTAWLPLRDGDGRIRSAKVERKAAVDFLGVYRGQAIAFDAKHCSADRVRWDRVEPH